jgi:cation diffusion facilitator family transporter
LANDTSQLKQRVTIVGAAVNVVLAAGKVVFGVLGQSQALIVDGIHSLSDLLSDGVVLAASRVGSKGPDLDHPYGHARIETAATIGIGILLLLVAAGFAWDAMRRILDPDLLWQPGWIALVAAVVSVLAKEALYHYTVRAGRRARSRLIEANAWHHRSDALSSIVVVAGVIGAMAGALWLDAVAAIVVAAMVGWVGWKFAWSAVSELVDTGLEPRELNPLHEKIEAVKGVRAHHSLRTRRMGADVLVDVHVLVDPNISVSEGHRIADEVRARLIASIEDIVEVLVHVDHEPDTDDPDDGTGLPLRENIEADLRAAWASIAEVADPERIVLHYHGNRVDVEVLLPADRVAPQALAELTRRLNDAASGLHYTGTVRVMLG